MESFINTVFSLIITGLGFLSYKHPSIARKILFPLNFVGVGIFLLAIIYNHIQSSSYYEAKDVVRSSFESKKQVFLDNDVSFYKIKDLDSIKTANIERRFEIIKNSEIREVKSLISDSIHSRLDRKIEIVKGRSSSYFLFWVIAFLVINVFIGLSFLFDKIHENEKLKAK